MVSRLIESAGGNISEACLIRSKSQIITSLYEGIPETLLLNVIGWLILILLFSVLRQQAWDYGRLALVSSNGDNKRWTQIFYAPTSDDGTTPNKLNENNAANGSTATINSTASTAGPSIGPIDLTSGSSSTSIHETIQRSSSQTTHIHKQNTIDRGFLSWLPATIRLTRDQILDHSGPDAVHYLSFQQHLMVVMVSDRFLFSHCIRINSSLFFFYSCDTGHNHNGVAAHCATGELYGIISWRYLVIWTFNHIEFGR